MKFETLPSLPFGQQIEYKLSSVDTMCAALGQLDGWSAEFSPLGPKEQFAAKIASVNINGLNLSAVTHSPIQSRTSSLHTSTIFVPFFGGGNGYLLNGHPVDFAANQNGAFAPVGERAGAVDYRSMILLDVDNARLERTVSSMLGHGDTSRIGIDFSIPKEISVKIGNIALDTTLAQLCNVVDQFCTSSHILNSLAIDESYYRIMAMLMLPERLMKFDLKSPAHGGMNISKRINVVCEYVMSNLDQSITLTELERVSNLSARTLQYAFLKTFSCSPMQWVTNQRYDRVNQRLRMAKPHESVTSIAMFYNFYSLSLFSAGYKKRFGELPSQTLAKSKFR